MEVLGDLFDGQRGVRVRHDGADGFGAGGEAAGPVERLGGSPIAAHRHVEAHLRLRLRRLGRLVLGAQPKTTSSLAIARSGRT